MVEIIKLDENCYSYRTPGRLSEEVAIIEVWNRKT